MSLTYEEFIHGKSQLGEKSGFKPVWRPDFLFDFQHHLSEWSIEKGRSAIFADCGLGKTPLLLTFAENVVRKTNGNTLICTPLGVTAQTIQEGEKFGVEVKRSKTGPAGKITVTNYEQLHNFDPNDFNCFIGDESSVIKNHEAERQKIVTEFSRRIPFRLLCTATAAPNDYIELGTTAEALGELGRMDMLNRFFRNDENSNHPIWWGARWRFKAHAEMFFWKWVCSWSRAIRKPSDLGFSDRDFILPPLYETETVIANKAAFKGELFPVQARTLQEQKEERRLTIKPRCECAAEKVTHFPSSLVWCHLNSEAELLEKLIPESKNIDGDSSDEEKEEAFLSFAKPDGTPGKLKRLISKQRIAGFGLNFQNCHHQTCFPSHSFESHYQGIRRCWRFGQKHPVTIDMITTEGELGVLKNLQRKSEAATKMFDMLVQFMNEALKIERKTVESGSVKLPNWI